MTSIIVAAISFYEVRAGLIEAEIDFGDMKEGRIIQRSRIESLIKEFEPCLVWIHGRVYERGPRACFEEDSNVH